MRASAASFSCDLTQGDGSAVIAPTGLQVGDTVAVSLPDGVSFSFLISAAPPAGIAGPSFIARDAASGASAILKPLHGSGMRISIDDFSRARAFGIRIKDGRATFTARDTSSAPADSCATCTEGLPQSEPAPITNTPTSKTSTAKPRLAAGSPFPLAAQKSVVDILVAFDQGAKATCVELGFDGIDDFADYAVNKMNTVLANSQLDDQFCYRLAGIVEIDGSWSAINNELLLSMRAREGKFAKLSQLRDKCGADTITLLVNRTKGNTAGIGFEYSGNAGQTIEYFNSMDYACNVCDINTVHSRYTMSHETGHNMGC